MFPTCSVKHKLNINNISNYSTTSIRHILYCYKFLLSVTTINKWLLLFYYFILYLVFFIFVFYLTTITNMIMMIIIKIKNYPCASYFKALLLWYKLMISWWFLSVQTMFNESLREPFTILNSISHVQAAVHTIELLLLRIQKDPDDTKGSGFSTTLEWVTVDNSAGEHGRVSEWINDSWSIENNIK